MNVCPFTRRVTTRPSRRAHGFTLFELMVVLVLIGILTAMILPEFRGTYEAARLRSTGRELVNLFRYAHSRSITLNQPHRVRMLPGQSRCVLERLMPTDLDGLAYVPIEDLPGDTGKLDPQIAMVIRKVSEPPSDEEPPLETPAPATSDQTIGFYPDGTAEPCEVLLRDRDGFRLAVRIHGITARIEVADLGRE